jgi:hypothetical protein
MSNSEMTLEEFKLKLILLGFTELTRSKVVWNQPLRMSDGKVRVFIIAGSHKLRCMTMANNYLLLDLDCDPESYTRMIELLQELD